MYGKGLKWRPIDHTVVNSGYTLEAEYVWDSHEWNADINVQSDNGPFKWRLNRLSSNAQGGQCDSIKDAISGCVEVILKQIEKHVQEYEKQQEEERKLRAHNERAQEWADIGKWPSLYRITYESNCQRTLILS